ncbi:MAG TPA: hypothetical protein VK982_06590 [Bacteroidales bacterium]|nr:hypothetical protein [Bacteroidales bacterium]
MNFFVKLWKTYGVIRDHWPELKAELEDLSGVTRIVITDILRIWKKI